MYDRQFLHYVLYSYNDTVAQRTAQHTSRVYRASEVHISIVKVSSLFKEDMYMCLES